LRTYELYCIVSCIQETKRYQFYTHTCNYRSMMWSTSSLGDLHDTFCILVSFRFWYMVRVLQRILNHLTNATRCIAFDKFLVGFLRHVGHRRDGQFPMDRATGKRYSWLNLHRIAGDLGNKKNVLLYMLLAITVCLLGVMIGSVVYIMCNGVGGKN